ncbi:UNVERIFIED_CONTAM: hypothetical protein FKN15_035042 [Acipenser sinensis]
MQGDRKMHCCRRVSWKDIYCMSAHGLRVFVATFAKKKTSVPVTDLPKSPPE